MTDARHSSRAANPERAAIDVVAMQGLEIGPLATPRIAKHEGEVYYLDHMSTEELRAKYSVNSAMAPLLDSIVEVDFVQRAGQSLAQAVGSSRIFDYVLASHVIEHVPNPIGWLEEVSAILRPGGILSLVVPDKRFTFDVNRTPTELSDLIEAYLRELRKPSYRQIFDFMARTVTIDGAVDHEGLWNNTVDYAGVVRSDVPDPDAAAFRVCLEHVEHPDNPIDVHCHVFTPTSFLQLIEQLMKLGLLDYEIAAYFPTEPNQIEFYVSLRKPEGVGSPAERRQRQLASVRALDGEADRVVPRGDRFPPGARWMVLSERERDLVIAKRRFMHALRHRLHVEVLHRKQR